MRINVLCLGESLDDYELSPDPTIGVNDINAHFPDTPVDYLVVIDPPNRFTPDRLRTISRSSPIKFFTNRYDEWRPIAHNLQAIELSAGFDLSQLSTPSVCHSNNSAFVATVLAYKLGAKEIVIYGADFNTHPNFHERSILTAIDHFSKLYKELKRRGVYLYVSSASSRLSKVLPVR